MDYFRFNWRGFWAQISNEDLKTLKAGSLVLMPNGDYAQVQTFNRGDTTPRFGWPNISIEKIDASTEGFIKAEYSTGFVDDNQDIDDDDDDNYDDYDDDDDYFEDDDGN